MKIHTGYVVFYLSGNKVGKCSKMSSRLLKKWIAETSY
jgi:hypothetical protein